MPSPKIGTKPLPTTVKLTKESKAYGIIPEKHVGETPEEKKKGASLYVNTKVEDPKFHGLGNEAKSPTLYTRGKDTFERYQLQPGVRDCAHNAEEFQHGTELRPPSKSRYTLASKEKVTGEVFGYSDEDNIAVSRKARQNNPQAVGHHADPQPGESYGIIRQHEPKEGESPYHFAPVVARDGRQTITAEQTATTEDGKKRDTYPTMDMYSVGSNKDSFQARYGRRNGYGTDAITVTTQKWGPETFKDGAKKPESEPEPTEPPNKRRRVE